MEHDGKQKQDKSYSVFSLTAHQWFTFCQLPLKHLWCCRKLFFVYGSLRESILLFGDKLNIPSLQMFEPLACIVSTRLCRDLWGVLWQTVMFTVLCLGFSGCCVLGFSQSVVVFLPEHRMMVWTTAVLQCLQHSVKSSSVWYLWGLWTDTVNMV